MKVLMISPDFLPNPGGVAVFLHNLCKQLALQGHHVDVLAPAMGNAVSMATSDGYRVHRFACWRRLASVPAIWLAMRLHLRHRYDVVFLGHVMSSRALGALVLNRVLGVPYVVLSHGNDLTYSVNTRADRRIVDLLMNHAALLMGNSCFTANRIHEQGYRRPARVLHPGVDLHLFHPDVKTTEVRRRYALDGHRVLLTVARLVAKKNVDGVLRALPHVIEQVPDLLYLIAGDGEERKKLESLSGELGLLPYVRFLGHIENSLLPALYCVSDVIVMPTKGVESFGIAFLEANACRKPVIGGCSGGVAEAVVDGQTGLMIDPHNTDKIAGAIIHLLTDRELAHRLGANGRRRVERELSWEKVGKRLAELLQDVISDPQDRRKGEGE